MMPSAASTRVATASAARGSLTSAMPLPPRVARTQASMAAQARGASRSSASAASTSSTTGAAGAPACSAKARRHCARVSTEFGLGHRMVVVPDAAEADRLREGFDALHWDLDRHLVMVLRREPDRAAPGDVDVRRLRFPAVKGPRRRILLEEPWGGDDVADQVLLRDRLIDEHADDQGFAAFVDGRPVAFCRLISGSGVGQVEDVATLPAHQNRGLARAVVSAAVAASRAAGHDLTIVVADADDWPKELYARLGFDELTLVHRWRIALATAG